jgi:hypothetical protein
VIAAWLSELEQPCGQCAHQQAVHTGGARREGWPVHDRIWVYAAGACTADGCACQRRVPTAPGQAGGLNDAQPYQQIAGWNTAVLTRAGMAVGTGPPAEDGGPVL